MTDAVRAGPRSAAWPAVSNPGYRGTAPVTRSDTLGTTILSPSSTTPPVAGPEPARRAPTGAGSGCGSCSPGPTLTRWVTSDPGRAGPISLWRRAEESVGRRSPSATGVTTSPHEEVVLRTGEPDPAVPFDPTPSLMTRW